MKDMGIIKQMLENEYWRLMPINCYNSDKTMITTFKDRVRLALTHQPVDRFPTQINFTSALGKILASHFNVPETALPGLFQNHIVRVDVNLPKTPSQDGKVIYDWWGVGFDAEQEGYFISKHPLSESKDLDAYPWPDPNNPALFSEAESIITQDAGQHFITPNLGFALFERAWSLRGLDAFMIDMALDPGYAEELLDRILEVQQVLVARYLDLGVDGGYFGDDYGAQKNMLFSPRMWRRFIKPRLARLFAPFRAAGLPVIMHSDGQIGSILPDLIEIGLTVLNPAQPEVLDHAWLRKTFGDTLAYYGGISTQTVLPSGSPMEIRQAVKNCLNTLAFDGTGLLLAPSHRMMTDIPIENIEALLDEFRMLEP